MNNTDISPILLKLLSIQMNVSNIAEITNSCLQKGVSNVPLADLFKIGYTPIKGIEEKIQILIQKDCTELSYSDFSRYLNVSRQTVYNWRDLGYLIVVNGKIDARMTTRLWQLISKLT